MTAIAFTYDDGGREAAGFKGDAGDCVTRAIAIATGGDYRDVYSALHAQTLADRTLMRRLEKDYGPRARAHASPRDGVMRRTYERVLEGRGWAWTPTMQIGSGCRVHLRADELPGGVLVVRLSKHLAAVKDGVLHDTHDCSRDGTRCVYGYWSKA